MIVTKKKTDETDPMIFLDKKKRGRSIKVIDNAETILKEISQFFMNRKTKAERIG